MKGGLKRTLARTVSVLAAYCLAAALFVLPLARLLKRTLVLPDLFQTLVNWGLALGLPLAALLAWHYPRLGWYGADGRDGADPEQPDGLPLPDALSVDGESGASAGKPGPTTEGEEEP